MFLFSSFRNSCFNHLVVPSSRSIHPLPSDLSQRASSPCLVQKGLGNPRGSHWLWPPGPEPSHTPAQLQLSRGGLLRRRGEPEGGSCFVPGNSQPEPGLRQSAAHSRGLRSPFSALAGPGRALPGLGVRCGRRTRLVRASLDSSFAFSAPIWGPPAACNLREGDTRPSSG